MMLSGTYNHSVDTKGRIIIPSRLRDDLGEKCVVSIGYEGCITIYAQEEWQKFMEGLVAKMPEEKAKARKLVRMFSARAAEADIDKQGRLLLPTQMREETGIEKDVAIIGNVNKVEVWSADKWTQYCEDNDQSLEELAEELFDLGF